MKLWIDDLRPAPEGYKWVKTVNEAKTHCCRALNPNKELLIEEFDLDHDAGDYEQDYIELLKWLEEKAYTQNWVINSVFKLHTGNIVGRNNMNAIIERNGWKKGI